MCGIVARTVHDVAKVRLNCCAQHMENVLDSLALRSRHCLRRLEDILWGWQLRSLRCAKKVPGKNLDVCWEPLLLWKFAKVRFSTLSPGRQLLCRFVDGDNEFWLFSARSLLLKWRVFVACSRKSIPRERGRIIVVVEAAFSPPLWLTSSQVYPPDWCKKWCTICCTELWRRVPIFLLESRCSWPLSFVASACSAFCRCPRSNGIPLRFVFVVDVEACFILFLGLPDG